MSKWFSKTAVVQAEVTGSAALDNQGKWNKAFVVPSLLYELISRKVTAWQSVPTDTAYPSEKLVKDSIDNIDMSDKVDTSAIRFNNYDLTPPVLADFTWANQGEATAVNTHGGVYLTAPAASSSNVRYMWKGLGGHVPYTVVAGFRFNVYPEDYNSVGILARKDSSGNFMTYAIAVRTTQTTLLNECFQDATTYRWGQENMFVNRFPAMGVIVWLKLVNDGTNRKFYTSSDGITWFSTFADTTDDWFYNGGETIMAEDCVGFFANTVNNEPAAIHLVHWVVTTP